MDKVKVNHGPVGFKTAMRIKAPLDKVWKAAITAKGVSAHFTMAAVGDLGKPGKVQWYWTADEKADLFVTGAVPQKRVRFHWNAWKVPYHVTCEFTFEKVEGKVRVQIHEQGWNNNKAGLESAFAQCGGWTEFLCGLKAYCQQGIDIRKVKKR